MYLHFCNCLNCKSPFQKLKFCVLVQDSYYIASTPTYVPECKYKEILGQFVKIKSCISYTYIIVLKVTSSTFLIGR